MPKSILLAIFTLITLIILFLNRKKDDTLLDSGRDAFLLASTSLGVFIVASIEILSLFHRLEYAVLIAAWTLFFLFMLGLLLLRLARLPHQTFRLRAIFDKVSIPGLKCSPVLVLLIGFILFQLVTLAMVAYQYPPNNWDSFTYHLPRVMHWEQNHSVADYPTQITRQVQMPPFAEFILLTLELFTYRDTYFNLSQWYALVVTIVAVTTITTRLGGSRIQQASAGVLCAALPIAIVQSTATTNDLVTAAGVTSLAAFLLALYQQPVAKRFIWGAGAALGLSLLTKGTAYLYALPLALLFMLFIFIKRPKKNVIAQGVVILVIAFSLNAGHYIRNLRLYGSPLGPTEHLSNEIFSLPVLVSNAIRNTALHVPYYTGNPVVDRVGKAMIGWLRLLHQFTGLSSTEPRTTLSNTPAAFAPFDPRYFFDEDYTGNFLHLLLILTSLAILIFGYYRGKEQRILVYFLAGLFTLMFILFSLYLKWEPWGSRLQLPMFALWCSLIPIVIMPPHPRFLLMLPLFAAVLGLFWTFNNRTRPITATQPLYLDRLKDYTIRVPEYYESFSQMADLLSSSRCTQLGLVYSEDTWEYPVWVFLKARDHPTRIEHVNVMNASKIYADPTFNPCSILSVNPIRALEAKYKVFNIPNFTLYIDPAYLGQKVPDH